MNANFYLAIDATARRLRSKACWIVPGRGAWLYEQLRSETARYARGLTALGVRPGDRLLAQVEKSAESLLLYLACLRAGAVYVPLNTAYTANEVRFFAADCEPSVMLVDGARTQGLRAVAADCRATLLTMDATGAGDWAKHLTDGAAVQSAIDAAVSPRQSGDLAAIVYTSGTTGRAKGAMITHGNLESNARALMTLWACAESDMLLHALPTYHIHGLFVALHCALLAGATLHLLPKFDLDHVLGSLPACTVFMGVPTYYTRLLADTRFSRALLGNMRLFVSGSAPLSPTTFAEFERRSGHRILERYGMSEAGIIASNPYDGERIAGSVGFALPGVSVRVADSHGIELPRGQAGVLEIKGPNLFQGYWRMAEQTAQESRADGYFITGDIATMTEDGRVSIVGRVKDLVISGGLNIYPREIEVEIDRIPGVQESAVIGVPHSDFGEAVVAVVALTQAGAISELQLLQSLMGRLAKFKQPRRAFFVENLPRNAMGKVQKVRLRELYADTFKATS